MKLTTPLPIELITIGSDLDKIPQEVPEIIVAKDFFTPDFYHGGYGFVVPILQKLGLEDIQEKEWGHKILIESAHPYVLDTSEDELKETFKRFNTPVGMGGYFPVISGFKSVIHAVGGEAINGIFIDDVHFAKELQGKTFQKFLDLPHMKLNIKVQNGITVYSQPYFKKDRKFDTARFESHYIERAKELVGTIQSNNNVKVGGLQRKHVKVDTQNRIYFYEKGTDGSDSQLPSCEFLDLAYQLTMSEQYDGIVILLPLEYKTQQERVLHLRKLLGLNLNIVTLLI